MELLACDQVSSRVGTSRDIESVRRSRTIKGAIQLLPQSQRVVIEMAFFQDLRQGSQIALKLGEPLGTITDPHAFRTRKNLKSHLTRAEIEITTAA